MKKHGDWDVPVCEHGVPGCLMLGDHLPEECHTVEMMEAIEDKGKILEFTGTTIKDLPCSQIIEGAQGQEFDRILIIGFLKGSDSPYVASHSSSIGEQLLLMERAKHFLLHDADTV